MRNEEFEAVKAELAREILNMDSEEVIERVRRSFLQAKEQVMKSDLPCRYSLDEVRQRLCNTEADAIAGRGLSEEEADKLFDEMI